MDFKGFAVAVGGVFEVAELEEGVALAGPGAEVAGHKFDGLVAVVDGLGVVFLEVAGDGALVVSFGEGGVQSDGSGVGGVGFVESADVEEACAFANFVVGAGRSGSEENRPEGMLGGSVNEFVVVAELFEQGSDAAFFAYPGEGENGDFAGVFVVAGEERQDLFDVPPGPGGDDESVEVLLLKQGLEYSDERITIERGGVSH